MKRFTIVQNGYNIEEVNRFIDIVIKRLEKLNNDNSLLGYHKGAIFFSAVTLIATVGSMLFAKHPAISSVGFSTLVGMLSAVILTWIMQPAIYELIIKRKR